METVGLARVSVRPAEPGFVSEENLEPGETLVEAYKAFAADGRFLCAGALLQRRSAALGADVHDAWIADSLERGVGANMQLRGAQLVLDRLFLRHLEAEDAVAQFSVLAGDGSGTVAWAANKK